MLPCGRNEWSEGAVLEQERLQPAHPGDVLAGEFLAPKGRIAGDTALR